LEVMNNREDNNDSNFPSFSKALVREMMKM